MTDRPSLSDLIERLEKATGPDRELDAEIQEAVVGLEMYESIAERGGERCIRYYPSPPGPTYRALPRYTSSIDAAMTLVPEGMVCGFSGPTGKSSGVGHEGMFFGTCGSVPDDGFHIAVIATSPALALCIAALKALAATRDGAD